MTVQLVEDYTKCGKDVPSLLLWLSSVRKLFSADSPGGTCDIDRNVRHEAVQSSALSLSSALTPLLTLEVGNFTPQVYQRDFGMEAGVKMLEHIAPIVRNSFLVPKMPLLSHENQFVCYLASKVLHLLTVASQSLTEEFLQQVISLVAHGSHVCLYCLQLIKELLKSIRKSSPLPEASTDCVVPFMLSKWRTIYAQIRTKLEEKSKHKWPELNFNMFISLSIEMLNHCQSDSFTGIHPQCFSLIAEHLEDLSSIGTDHCKHPESLKDLLKMYTKLIKLAKTQSGILKERFMRCVPKLFACESELTVRTCGLVVEAVREDEKEGRSLVSMEHGLHKTIARRAVLVLMQCATLLDDKAGILNFGSMLSVIHCRCGFEIPTLSDAAGMQAVRHALFHLLNEQDDAILQLLISSSELWKRRSLWSCQSDPVLQLFFSATQLHFMLVEFLESVWFDHSVLLDFIVSPEVSKFVEFLADYMETCCVDWSSLSAACQELDQLRACAAADYDKPALGATAYDYQSSPAAALSSATPPSSPSQAVYQETTLDKVMDCFTRLGFALERLSSSHLLPLPVERLTRALAQGSTAGSRILGGGALQYMQTPNKGHFLKVTHNKTQYWKDSLPTKDIF